MSAFGFDPEQLFGRRGRGRPRVVREGGGRHRRRYIVIGVIVLIVVVIVVGRWLLGLRSDYLFFKSLDHTNVFWTPFVSQLVLFIIGAVLTGALVGASVPFVARAARHLDQHGGRIVGIAGGIIALIAAVGGGIFLAAQWQTVLLWLHGQSFGASDPVFHTDYSFFIFTLPVIDDFSALLWAGAILGLIMAIAAAATALLIENAPGDVPMPLEPPPGSTPRDALRVALRLGAACLVAIFVLAALGAHFGVYHLATSSHDNGLVGLDATQRNVIRPVLGGLQVVALIFAAVTLVLLIRRWRVMGQGTGIALGALLFGWLIGAGLAQGIPAGIYQATSVNPNAQQAQTPTINDFLTTSRYAWAVQDSGSNPDVESRSFGAPHAPTLQDLLADIGTLRNVRIQDFRQLPDTLAQIDRSRSYQTYPTITVDRYADASGGDTEVMIGPREIAEGDIPNATFVNSALNYTHGYGVTAVSVNQVGSEGKPIILVGHQPMQQVAAGAPPDLYFDGNSNADPSIYCGLQTTQPVVSGTTQPEFDYPLGTGDHTSSAGSGEKGIAVSNPIDKLAVSLSAFGGFDLFLNNSLTSNSRVLVHRDVNSRISTLAPFLTVDGDPYVVVDPQSGHLMYIADAYIKTSLFPESYQLNDGTSYMRNAVKAVIDAKTCATTLYAVDLNEPLTAAWNAIYPGLMTPFDQMPSYLRAHLRYPEDLFTAQSQVYSTVHVHSAAVFFNGSDRYQLSQEQINGQQQATQAYYIEATLPGDSSPSFILFQTFSPGASGSGTSANNMTAWLAAECDYTSTNHPKLISVRLNNADNVLGPLQFDNNINTNPQISQQKTLLSQQGSQVILGNVIVLPFNNDSFLYVRPFYVLASSTNGTSFPQLTYVIVGTQNSVAEGTSFAGALQTLLNTTQQIPGLGTTPSPSPPPSPSPSPSGSAAPTPTPSPSALSQQLQTLLNKLIADNQAAQTALHNGDYTTYGKDEAAVQADLNQLQTLLSQPGSTATPSPSPSPSP